MNSRNLVLFAFVIGCIVIFTIPLQSQTFYGSIFGTVADSSRAVIPGAMVTLTNIGTSGKHTAATDTAGNYRFVDLVPGNYRMDIEKTGFKRLSREQVRVEVQAAVRVDAELEIGQVTEVVEVTAATSLLQTETTALGQVVESRTVQEMPLNGRNILNLVALVPGVVPQGQALGTPTGTNPFAWGNYAIGGAEANRSAAFIDGAPVNVTYINLTALIPTQDAVQEFRVQTNNLGPEFGRFQGGVVNLTSKSGSNAFHGSAYEFLRNKALNANTFFNNAHGVSTPAFTQNQFGANLGGPVIKDKTFFFFSYEGFRLRQGQSYLLSVPTAAMDAGDFSKLRDAKGNLTIIADPLTTCGTLGNSPCAVDSAGSPIYTRVPFPNNIIPPTRLDPTSKILTKLWAPPNTPGLPFTGLLNYSTNASVGGNNDQVNARVDQSVSEKQRIFGRFTRWTNLNLPIDPYRTQTCDDRCTETFVSQQAVIADTYVFNPTTIIDLRLSVLRFKYDRMPLSNGLDFTTVGWPAWMNTAASSTAYPIPNVEVYNAVFSRGGATSIIRDGDSIYAIVPTLTKIMGRHTLKFGGDMRRTTHNYVQNNLPGGSFNFSNIFTAVNPTAPGATGYGLASYMLGLGSGGSFQVIRPTAAAQKYLAFHASDVFQVTRNLTINYGVRWELPRPDTERFDRLTVLLLNAKSPIADAAGMPNLKAKVGLVNSPDWPSRYNAKTHWSLFAPRLGFAYRLQDKAVVRGGYGIFYNPTDSLHGGGLASWTTPEVTTLDGGVTSTGVMFSNPYPNGIIQPSGRNPEYQSNALGASVAGAVPGADEPFPYMQQWNFSIQRELFAATSLEVSYAGSKGTHLGAPAALNQLADQYLSLGSKLIQLVPNPFFGLIPTGTLAAANVQYGQLLRAYPQYSGVNSGWAGVRSSIYHSMQVKLEKRFKAGGTILASWAWSKNIGTLETGTSWLEANINTSAGIQNNNNLSAERSESSFGTTHRLVVSYVLDLPFGKGKKLLGGVSGIADRLVSGWGINGVSMFQSGFPLGLSTFTNLTRSFGGGSRPNYVGGCDAGISGSAQSRLGQWFNTSCFTAPPAYTFGNLGRTLSKLRTHGVNNFDFALFKRTKVSERVALEFRTEFFNLFNRVQFGSPDTSLGSPTFGVVGAQVNNPRLVQVALRLLF